MSTPSAKAGISQSSKTTDAEGAAQAIPTIQSPLAQAVRHVHPALLVSFFYLRFRSLVADPVATMWCSLPAVIAMQVAYAVVCLPPAGSQSFKPPKKLRPGEKKKSATDSHGPNVPVTATVALILSVFASAILHIFFVLFGAPFLTHIPHTLLCSLYLSLFGLFPLFYTHGVSTGEWLEILGVRAPFDEALGGLVGGCVGAWLGAVPIPLDWDREWQKWPITILCGVYGGYIVGKFIGGTVAFGKRFS